ncbi:MAG: MFS transporter [Armatimonadetes bacterium]|nr:MFS transporter [Armatimonadota bacterium]
MAGPANLRPDGCMDDQPLPQTTVYEDLLARWKQGRIRLFSVLWVTYSAFYLSRSNLSPAKSTLERAVGLSKAEQGYLDFLFKGGYAAGQWLGGVFGDRYGGRVLLATGALGGALMCMGFGLSRTFAAFSIFWLLNGIVQSIAWPGVTKCFANWFPPRLRGKLHGLLCSSYQVGPAVALVVVGAILDRFDWPAAFFIPAAVLFVLGVLAAVLVRESPQRTGLPSLERLDAIHRATRLGAPDMPLAEDPDEDEDDRHLGYRYTLKRTLANPRIWCLCMALLCIDIARHGTFDWLPRYFSDLYPDMPITTVALRAWTVPLGGILGASLAGWASDHFFGSRRAPLAAVLLAVVGALMFVWARHGALIAPHAHLFLFVMGFCIYAPQVLIIGPLTMDLATRKAAASASGIVGTFGYGGAALMSIASGEILERAALAGDPLGGWRLLFDLWWIAAFAGVLFMLPLWRFRPGGERYY